MPRRPLVIPLVTPHRRRRGGFALLITVTLLAFLVLLLVSLATLTRVETQVATNSQSLAQARQNALMALNLALGQLQKFTGPDQRVTASADVLPPPSSFTWSTNPDPATARTADTAAIDAYWNNTSRNRRWTGVWKNGNTAAYDKENPAGFNPSPELLDWLVSGNETAVTFTPSVQLSGLTVDSAATDDTIKGPADADYPGGRPYRLLVGKNSTAASGASDLDRLVTAPEVPIKSSAVPGLAGPATVGHYAWWVGDEGVKARANLIDPYAADTTDEGRLRRRSSAQRPAIEAITTDGTDGFAALYPANDARLESIVAGSQMKLLSADSAWSEALGSHFHDLTIWSRGVLSDARHGGLKRDLSYLLGQPDVNAFRTALNAAYGGGAAPGTAYNPALSPVSTPYATLPDGPTSYYPYGSSSVPGILSYSTTWEQLWSFANMGNASSATPAGVYNAAGEAEPRVMSGVQHGLYPLLIQTKLFYRLRIVGGVADSDGTNRQGEIWVDVIPLAVLANPYDVPLAAADYRLGISDIAPLLRFGTDPNPPAGDGLYTTYPSDPGSGYTDLPGAYLGNTQLILRCTGLAPGEAQIFTLDPDASENKPLLDDRIEITRNGTKQVILHNDYNPASAITFNTGQHIPADKTYAALRTTGSNIILRLYLGTGSVTSDYMIQYDRCQSFMGTSLFLTVSPMQNGVQQGGGFITVRTPPPITGLASLPQQAPFYQTNYRALVAEYHGNPTKNPHLAEWNRAYAKPGTGSSSDTLLEADLMRPSGGLRTTRWGVVTMGDGKDENLPPPGLGDDTGFQNLLYDLPHPGQHLASLGQLQHLNTTGHIPVSNFAPATYPGAAPTVVHSWQVNYPVSNSYAHPRVSREKLFDYADATGYHYDGSYLWNDLLWDRFFFSTYPQSGSFDFAADKLVNARYRPFRDRGAVPWDDETRFRGDGNPATAANSRAASENLLVDGAFNINSTSVDAWKAVFSSLRKVPVGTETSPSAPFARTLSPLGGSADAKTGASSNAWNGFRDLTASEINALADEMVLQVRKRGPFLSLADFVNRRLVAAASDTLGLGLSGALQSALDRVVNLKGNVLSPFNRTSLTPKSASLLRDDGYLMSSGLAGFPGYVLQGDVLSVLGPTLSARSDTFTIRTYGDAANPATGDVTGRAWCEAIVQRLPDYVVPKSAGGDDPSDTPAAGSTNDTFGRRYHIVSFRWLGPDDL